jgi:hypothetical protein
LFDFNNVYSVFIVLIFLHFNYGLKKLHSPCFYIHFLSIKGPVLHFPSVTEEDSGKYFCIADNHIDKGARFDTKIEVFYLPPVVTAVNTTITTGRGWGKYVKLRCVVDGKISKFNFSFELNILRLFTR